MRHDPVSSDPSTFVNPGATLRISVVGRFRVFAGETEIALANRKTRALIACLALHDGGEMTRDRLVGLLWSESEESRARASLRQALHELRDALIVAGFLGLHADKLRVMIDRSRVSIDIAEALEDARQGRVHAALRENSAPIDDLLVSLEAVDPAFRSWIIAKRTGFENQLTQRFETALAQPDVGIAEREELARALLALDPTHEIGVRNLMVARLSLGDTAGALSAYKSLWDLLDAEYETEPSKPTQELCASIKMADSSAQPQPIAAASLLLATNPLRALAHGSEAAHTAGAGAKLVISFAPFDVTGTRPDNQYLIHGFRRDLMSCLVRFRGWLVRNSESGAMPDTFGFDEYVVEASAFEHDGEIRLALLLRESSTGIFLWSERLTVSISNWIETQQTIVRRLAAVLNVHISSSRLGPASESQSQVASVYDSWLRAQAWFSSWTVEGYDRALSLLRQITIEHPGFAPAFSSIAQLENSVPFMQPGLFRSVERTRDALLHADQAARLDPVDSRSHLALGWAHALVGQAERAAIHHDLAQELNDNDSWTLTSSGLGAAARGDHAKARVLCERAFELSVTPTGPHWGYASQIAFLRGDYETCVEAAGIAGTSIPSAPGWRIAALGNLGRSTQARAEFEQFSAYLRGRWVSEESPTDATIVRWFLHLFPFYRAQDWDLLRDGFEAAGITTEAPSFAAMQAAYVVSRNY